MSYMCLSCSSEHPLGNGECPTCGGRLALPGYVDSAKGRLERHQRRLQRHRRDAALRSWHDLRVWRVELALLVFLAGMVLAAGVQFAWHAPLASVGVAIATLLAAERVHRISASDYYALPLTRDPESKIHRCLHCASPATYTTRSLLGGTHVHCVWCRAQLYSA